MSADYRMIAKTLYGLEEVLEQELLNLGATLTRKGTRMVSFSGDKGFMYKANLMLRTALRILVPIHEATIRNEQQLYDEVKSIDWSQYMYEDSTLAIDATTMGRIFTHNQYAALKSKDAIVDQWREKTGKRPSIDTKHPDLLVSIHISEDKLTISLDSSGQLLSQRGYRDATHPATLNECLAAGILLLAEFSGNQPFVDPMCGSGTLAIEAALIASQKGPNLDRLEFAFEKWSNYDNALFETIEQAMRNRITPIRHSIIASDNDRRSYMIAKQAIADSGFSENIELHQSDFFKGELPLENSFIAFNPPYDERLRLENTSQFYGQIGATLKHHAAGSKAAIITSSIEGSKSIGLKPAKRIKLRNAKLDAQLLIYQLFVGKRIDHLERRR